MADLVLYPWTVAAIMQQDENEVKANSGIHCARVASACVRRAAWEAYRSLLGRSPAHPCLTGNNMMQAPLKEKLMMMFRRMVGMIANRYCAASDAGVYLFELPHLGSTILLVESYAYLDPYLGVYGFSTYKGLESRSVYRRKV